ncbi:MAG: 50S ribosomal protein L3 [Malacoplasma sp.]
MKMILGKKIGMTQCFCVDGKLVPATIIYVEPNVVLANKTIEKDGYLSTKVGFYSVKEKSLNRPELGVFKKVNCEPKRFIREFRDVTGYKVGDKISADIFSPGENVDVQSISKGHGFTGAIKRWNFSIGPKTHGAGYPHRYQGSISFGRGGSQGQRVMKGKKMSGHMGCDLVTISNLVVLKIEISKNLILVKGAIPGPIDCLVCIKSSKKKNKHPDFEIFSNAKTSKPNSKVVLEEKDTPIVESNSVDANLINKDAEIKTSTNEPTLTPNPVDANQVEKKDDNLKTGDKNE